MAHISLLPIDLLIDEIVSRVRQSRAAVVTAAPGAGKTTRVPPALLSDGPVILLQPRRVAARAIAARIADERGWTLGGEVGWQVHADLAIALARQAWRARNDLRIVVMSATLESASVSAFLDGCPVIDVAGRTHPIDVTYHPGQSVADAAVEIVARTKGNVLCFLPGAFEIRRAVTELQHKASGVNVVPLHGSLTADEQDLALRPSTQQRVIVATNIAETSLTVPDVTAVVDAGLQKVARYDADRGIDSLETERITLDAAAQRAGRAGRLAPGLVRRLWDARDRLRPHREPDIHRIDLAATALGVIAWGGGDPRTFEWFEVPREDALDAALTLLARLGLVELRTPQYSLTPIGEQVRQLPLHPRLARMLVEAGGSRQIAQACAVLSERHLAAPRSATTSSDLLSALDNWSAMPEHVKRVAESIADRGLGSADSIVDSRSAPIADSSPREEVFLRAVLAGYPDRVAQRREPGSANVLLGSGTGAIMAPESGVLEGKFLVALDVRDTPGSNPQCASVRMASLVDRGWLHPTASAVVHRFDKSNGRVKAIAIDRYDALVLAERPVPVDPEIAAQLLADAWLARGPRDDDARLLRRLKFAAVDVDLVRLVRTAAYGVRTLDEVRLARALDADILRARSRCTGVTRRSQRPPRAARVQRRWERVGVGQAAGAVWTGGDAAHRTPVRSRRARAARAERPPGPTHARSQKLVGLHVSGSEKRVERTVSAASAAGGSMDGAADGAYETHTAEKLRRNTEDTTKSYWRSE